MEKIITLSDFFGVSTDYLLKGEEQAAPSPAPEPSNPQTSKPDGMLFAIVGTVLNLAGLLLGSACWYEYQNALSIAAELILMLLGCTIFVIGMTLCAPETKKAALRRFTCINVWIVVFPLLSLFFNVALAWGYIAPYPVLGLAFEWVAFVVLYVGICIAIVQRVRDSLRAETCGLL